ncbi:MAG: YCF48-related protein [Phycisphaerales bacterium]|nr:YCF48-related protein [Phycisphaerales bacterium]
MTNKIIVVLFFSFIYCSCKKNSTNSPAQKLPPAIFVSGDNGKFFISYDTGLTWTEKTIGGDPNENIVNVLFFNSQLGYCVTVSTAAITNFFKTTDGGLSWSNSITTVFPMEYIAAGMSFPTPDNGYMAIVAGFAAGILYQTLDSGRTWALLNNFSSLISTVWNVFTIPQSSPKLLIMGISTPKPDWGTIIYSADGGASFIEAIDPVANRAFVNMFFADTNVGYATGFGGLIAKTMDGGQSWNIVSSNISTLINKSFFQDDNNGYLVGDKYILRTNDGLTTSPTIVYQDGNILWQSVYAYRQSVWVTGEDTTNKVPILLQSKDGGNTWSPNAYFMSKKSVRALFNIVPIATPTLNNYSQ